MNGTNLVHQDEPSALPQRPSSDPSKRRVLHGTFAGRTIRAAGLEPFFPRYGGVTNAAGETSFEEKTYAESRAGVGGRWIDVFNGGRRISSSRADYRRNADAEPWTGSPGHAWRRRNR
jgi:hypothetical protein